MEKVFEINCTRDHPWMIARGLHHPHANVTQRWHAESDTPAAMEQRAGTRLPPTRAARTSRSRGVFLAVVEPTRRGQVRRVADLCIAALALAVVAIASVLIMGAPATIMGVSLNLNPGPAIVGAASVPPSFVEPSKGR